MLMLWGDSIESSRPCISSAPEHEEGTWDTEHPNAFWQRGRCSRGSRTQRDCRRAGRAAWRTAWRIARSSPLSARRSCTFWTRSWDMNAPSNSSTCSSNPTFSNSRRAMADARGQPTHSPFALLPLPATTRRQQANPHPKPSVLAPPSCAPGSESLRKSRSKRRETSKSSATLTDGSRRPRSPRQFPLRTSNEPTRFSTTRKRSQNTSTAHSAACSSELALTTRPSTSSISTGNALRPSYRTAQPRPYWSLKTATPMRV